MDKSGRSCKMFEPSFRLLDSSYLDHIGTRLSCCYRDKSCLRGTVSVWPFRLMDKSGRSCKVFEPSFRFSDSNYLENRISLLSCCYWDKSCLRGTVSA